MNEHLDIIKRYYTAFQNKDYKTMQDCYSDKAHFSDPIFTDLNADEVKAMWKMLCINGKDLELKFDNIQANENSGSADWVATYTFSKTGNRVINKVHSSFKFDNNKIVDQKDQFNFYDWAYLALGLPGILFGWTLLIKNKVRRSARKSLDKFMRNNS
jgi:hypothetical protein